MTSGGSKPGGRCEDCESSLYQVLLGGVTDDIVMPWVARPKDMDAISFKQDFEWRIASSIQFYFPQRYGVRMHDGS
jgi:hypothetical protein